MAKKKRLSRDQKRKAKLAARSQRPSQASSLAYTGNRFKKDEFTPLVFSTELGIHEADVMSSGVLTDRIVTAALERLVHQLRHGPLPPLDETSQVQLVEGQEQDLVIWCIRRQWKILSEEGERYNRDDTIGVLRTLLNSVDTWSTGDSQSRGYLQFLKGFLRNAGASVQVVDEHDEPLDEEDEDELLAAGEAWVLDGDREAEAGFKRMAEELLRSGEADYVASVSRQLLGTVPGNQRLVVELSALALRADAEARRQGP